MVVDFSLNKIDEAAETLLSLAKGCSVIALQGQMGAGKTTFIMAMCRQLGIADNISSPTFSIINEYRNGINGNPVYHMDLYRLQSEAEAINAGVEDCLFSGNLCFVEWPERIPAIFPPATLYCRLLIVDDSHRRLEINL